MFWRAVMILSFSACLAAIGYLSLAFSRFAPIEKAAGGRRWLALLISLGLILGTCYAAMRLLSLIDAIVILLHVLFAFLLVELVFFIRRKATGKRSTAARRGLYALLAAALYLTAGYVQCEHVWKTEYALTSDKLSKTVRVAVFSDSHVGTSFDAAGFEKKLWEIVRQEPDLLLIPGDFVDDDTSREDMIAACEALGCIELRDGVWFAYGNHDKGYSDSRPFTAEELEQTLLANGVHILEDECACVGELCLVGRRDASTEARADISELLADADTAKYIIVLDHEPNDYDREAETEADLVLSGHTHGGQLIPLGLVGRFFGFNDRTYGLETRKGTSFIVSSGISDWIMHFKTGTRSEYLIITIDPA